MGSSAIARLRKAVDNQAALGESEFRLPIMDMCRLVQRASEEMREVDLPVDADGERVLDTTGEMHEPSGLHVRRPELDSWERLETELKGVLSSGMLGYCDAYGIDYNFAPISDEMIGTLSANVAKSMVARAKKLAEVTE